MSTEQQHTGDAWSEPHELDDVVPIPAQPAGSVIAVKRFDDGISISVPPAGLWHGSRGLFFFSLLWNGFMVFFTAGTLGGALAADNDEWNVWMLVLFFLLFWAVGISMFLASLHMGRRRAGLAVAGGTLMAMQTGLFGTKQREWLLDQVTAIRVGPTGWEVNDTPVMQLQIHDSGGGKLGLLAGRSDDELQWLAHELRVAAGVPE